MHRPEQGFAMIQSAILMHFKNRIQLIMSDILRNLAFKNKEPYILSNMSINEFVHKHCLQTIH